MEVNKKEVRNCLTCEYYEIGCEENCPFELEGEADRPSLSVSRKNMKAEKANAYTRAMQKLNSAENKAAATTNYEKSKSKRIKDIEKEIEQLEDVHECKMGEPLHDYPEGVFRARANAIKQAGRLVKRQKKNQAKK